jgi:Flp pilus assembly protein TadB
VSGGAVLAAIAGALTVAGLVLIAAAIAGADLLPPAPAGRPGRRHRQWSRRRVLAEAAAVTAGGTATWVVTGWPVAALAVAAAVVALPRMLGGRAAQQRIGRLDAMEAWTRQLADALTAGSGIEEALLATTDDPPMAIAGEVTALRRRLEYRVPTEEALAAFADELAHPVGDTIAASLIIASRLRGRGLHPVLTTLAGTVAKQVAMEREIDAERATHRTTAVWVVAALGLYTVFAVLNRTYVAPFGTLAGQLMLAVVAALYAATLWWLNRLASPGHPSRFLPATGAATLTSGVTANLRSSLTNGLTSRRNLR